MMKHVTLEIMSHHLRHFANTNPAQECAMALHMDCISEKDLMRAKREYRVEFIPDPFFQDVANELRSIERKTEESQSIFSLGSE